MLWIAKGYERYGEEPSGNVMRYPKQVNKTGAGATGFELCEGMNSSGGGILSRSMGTVSANVECVRAMVMGSSGGSSGGISSRLVDS